MFDSSRLDSLRASFTGQFKADGGRVLYRRNSREAPVEVSTAERDMLTAQFGRRVGRVMWIVYGGTAVTILAITLMVFLAPKAPVLPVSFVILALTMAVYLSVYMWAWNAPRRLTQGRTAMGAPLSADEARRAALVRLSWSKITAAAAGSVFLLLRVHWHESLWRGENLAWLAGAGALLGVCAVQAVRKVLAAREAAPTRLVR